MSRPENLSDLPPNQYTVGDRCEVDLGGCGRPLSRYNPYVVCGPCRVKLASTAVDVVEDMDAEEPRPIVFAWERLPKRDVVRRGPLLAETGARIDERTRVS